MAAVDHDRGVVPGAVRPADRAMETGRRGTPRADKFRQAAFVYLHVGILYEFAAYVLWRQGILPESRGPAWIWLLAGAALVALIFAGLWRWQNAWLARIVWAVHALRLPAIIQGAFFPAPDASIPPAFYLTALPVILVNLWMLARAGWDL